jgi:hypothetical protein
MLMPGAYARPTAEGSGREAMRGVAMVLEGMEPDVRDAIAKRAKGSAAEIAQRDGDQVVLAGSVLIGMGRKPAS